MRLLYFIPRFASGGAEAFIVNVCEQMVARGHSCGVVSIDARESVYDSRLKKLGVERTTLVGAPPDNLFLLYKNGLAEFENMLSRVAGDVDVIHFNIAQGEELPFIWAAKRQGIPSRILHSHNSGVNSKVKLMGHKLCRALFCDVATSYMACSEEAAQWLLPTKVINEDGYSIIKNGINTARFIYDEERRAVTRRELGISSDPCLLIVGRLDKQKNHAFLLDVLARLVKNEPRVKLVCVGDGPLKRELVTKAKELQIDGNIMWLGVREDVPALLCAADCFVLPSLFEGFPFCLIEAQASGLRCVVADTVSSQCALTDLLEYCSLDADAFVAGITSALHAKTEARCNYASRVREAGYDISATADALLAEYEGRCR